MQFLLTVSLVFANLLAREAFSMSPFQVALKCVKENCDIKNEDNEIKTGQSVCAEDDDGTKIGAPKCTAECMGLKILENQKKCFCEACKMHKHDNFCKKPNDFHISHEDCESKVCLDSDSDDDVKWYGNYCREEI